MSHNDGYDFKLERYKFILQEIHSLNENVQKYLTLFQALSTGIIGGGIGILLSWSKLDIDASLAILGLRGLVGLLVVLGLFVIISMLAGVFSWFDYRKEEVKLLNDITQTKYREAPKVGNIWRWSETYFILFVIAFITFAYFFVENRVIPLIK